jgi:hypothetical protein
MFHFTDSKIITFMSGTLSQSQVEEVLTVQLAAALLACCLPLQWPPAPPA